MTAHDEKYEAIAQWLGVHALAILVPFTADEIRTALASGDEHLNTLALSRWDRMHGAPVDTPTHCRECGHVLPVPTATGVLALVRHTRGHVPGTSGRLWSLSDSVCVLKHVARYHVARSL